MSKKFNKVKNYFDNGYWTAEQVYNAVIKNWITSEEYTMITGLDYYEKEL